MKRSIFPVILLLCAPSCWASDTYFAATSAGSNNGTSCANAYAYNDGTHGLGVAGTWASGAWDIGAYQYGDVIPGFSMGGGFAIGGNGAVGP
jgi:hypothetical protein